MDDDLIRQALRTTSDTQRVIVGDGALGSVASVLRECFESIRAVLIADDHTFAAVGREVRERLEGEGIEIAATVLFPGEPPLYASYEQVLELQERLRDLDATPVVVGSGTLNDITKLAAHRVGRAYLVVATAASMDGYAAFGAAITKDGFKQTMSCPAPKAVVADIDVLASAPVQMSSSGYGDLLGKITAGADWLLADALEIEPIDRAAWSLVQDRLRDWTCRPQLLRSGDRRAIELLFEGLVASGLAMQVSASSRPASGSEHRFSHLWEMQALERGDPVIPHGFKVGIGCIAAAALYERVLARDLARLDTEALCRAWPSRHEVEQSVRRAFGGSRMAEPAVEESLAKYIDAGQLRRRLALLRERWPALREQLQSQLMSARQIADLLEAAGCPTEPASIGLTIDRLRESYELAQAIRRRYTVLDLAAETGILSGALRKCLAQKDWT
jgi:glycerol-1-phosphate dehydrogenase [NAD(P)+]